MTRLFLILKCKDVVIFVVGDYDENELLLSNTLENLYESLNHFANNDITKKNLLDKFEEVILIIDEMIDEG